MALVGGTAGREGSTELRKATGFWMRLVGETGEGDTQRGWNWVPVGTVGTVGIEKVSRAAAGSGGPGRGASFRLETPPRGLICRGGWDPERSSLLAVL